MTIIQNKDEDEINQQLFKNKEDTQSIVKSRSEEENEISQNSDFSYEKIESLDEEYENTHQTQINLNESKFIFDCEMKVSEKPANKLLLEESINSKSLTSFK